MVKDRGKPPFQKRESRVRGRFWSRSATGFGAGAESRRPIGITVVGGMLTSTFLTLVIIPVVYTLFSDAAGWFSTRFRAPATRNMHSTKSDDHGES